MNTQFHDYMGHNSLQSSMFGGGPVDYMAGGSAYRALGNVDLLPPSSSHMYHQHAHLATSAIDPWALRPSSALDHTTYDAPTGSQSSYSSLPTPLWSPPLSQQPSDPPALHRSTNNGMDNDHIIVWNQQQQQQQQQKQPSNQFNFSAAATASLPSPNAQPFFNIEGLTKASETQYIQMFNDFLNKNNGQQNQAVGEYQMGYSQQQFNTPPLSHYASSTVDKNVTQTEPAASASLPSPPLQIIDTPVLKRSMRAKSSSTSSTKKRSYKETTPEDDDEDDDASDGSDGDSQEEFIPSPLPNNSTINSSKRRKASNSFSFNASAISSSGSGSSHDGFAGDLTEPDPKYVKARDKKLPREQALAKAAVRKQKRQAINRSSAKAFRERKKSQVNLMEDQIKEKDMVLNEIRQHLRALEERNQELERLVATKA